MNTKVNTTTELRKVARKASNIYLHKAHTATLAKLLVTFNYHFNFEKALDREREELISLVKVQRNKILWGAAA